MNFFIVLGFALTLLCSCLFVAYFGKNWDFKPYVALGSGALLAICFLDFLPHSFENQSFMDVIAVLILFGILIQGLADIYLLPRLSFLDKFLYTKTPHSHAHSHTLSVSSVCSVAGCLFLCSFFDGIRLFSALSIERSVAFVTGLALFFHLLSEGVLVAVLALGSGMRKQAIFVLAFCVSGSLVLGASLSQVLFLNFSSQYVIAFSTGILIYICFVHLLPFSLKQNNKSWFFIGLILFSFVHFLV